jgi:hypothetical protein
MLLRGMELISFIEGRGMVYRKSVLNIITGATPAGNFNRLYTEPSCALWSSVSYYTT